MRCKDLIIVGAGGLAKELIGYIDFEKKKGLSINIKGVIVDGDIGTNTLINDLKYLGNISDYSPKENDVFLVCIGENPGRKKVIDILDRKNASFYTFVSSLAYVNPSASLGEGVVVAPFCIVNADVSIGAHTLMNSYSAVGHDSVIGEHAILSPYAAINGNCKVGPMLMMGTKSTIFPKVKMGINCTITSHSFVKSDKGDNRFIHIKSKEIDLLDR